LNKESPFLQGLMQLRKAIRPKDTLSPPQYSKSPQPSFNSQIRQLKESTHRISQTLASSVTNDQRESYMFVSTKHMEEMLDNQRMLIKLIEDRQ